MPSDFIPVSLETIAGGAACERFNDELAKVLENILDPNTDPKVARRISLVVTIKPNENREAGAVSVAVASKLAAPRVVPSALYIGRKDGQVIGLESNPKQARLEFDEETPDQTAPAPPTVINGGKR